MNDTIIILPTVA